MSSTRITAPHVPADTVIVIDAGTSALRAVAVRSDGNVRVIAREPWRMFIPDDAAPFGREFDPHDIVAALDRALAAAAPERQRIAGVAVTGQREGIAFVDEAGTALFASPNVDARASAEGIATDAAHGAEVYATTGHLPSLMQAPAKLAWLRAHRPEVAARARHVLPLADWIAMMLTGRAAVSRSLAAENGLLDIATGLVAADLLERLGLPPACVPDIVADGAVAGEVREGAIAGVPVVLAGADTQCALLGIGVVDPGVVGVPAGWSAPLQMVTEAPVFDGERRTWTSVHVAPGRWILESNAGECGRAWEWIGSMMGVGHEEALALAAAAPGGAHDAMAVLGARAMRAGEMAAGVGALTLPLPIAMSAPERGDVLRSVLEATAYALRANLEQLEAVSGMTVARLHLGGGMSRSELFAQIVADVVDRPIEVARSSETSAVGAAALASVALRLHSSLDGAIRSMAGGRRMAHPVLAASAEYEDLYARWCALSDEMTRIGSEIG
jgi:autoinducer 2 (AI-2) kinase